MNTNNNQNKKRIKDLGIFYTPQVVVDFIFDILEIWKKKQINRWKTKDDKHKYPSVIDPSVGEGIFLKTAIAKNFTKPEWIFGLDIDENAVIKWKEINLLKEFGGIDEDLEAHFFHQNGLEKIKWEQHKYKYRYKLKQIDIENQQFDAIVGNPPYGGVGLGQSKLTDELIEQLSDFEILPKSIKNVLGNANIQPDFFNSDKSFSLSNEVKQKIKSFPIEILFLERFIQLAKPGGWVAVIIPDGILTNSNSDYVREFISKRTKIKAIISLPRNTFKDAGTNAKTSILFLRKLKESEKSDKEYNIFLSSIEEISQKYFNDILSIYKNFYNGEFEMDKNKLIQITKDQNGREAVMVRVDKTLKEMMEEKPSSRWNVDYWHPKYEEILRIIRKWPTILLSNHREQIISGYRSGGVKFEKSGYPYLQVRNILETGIDLFNVDYISNLSPAKQNNKKVKKGDILLNRSGEGSVGRLAVSLSDIEAYVGGHVYRFSVNNISPIYVTVFLKTIFGKNQIHRFESGVSGKTEIDLEEILNIEIPIINNITKHLEDKYNEMSDFHNKAMEAMKNSNEIKHKQNIEIAEKLLRKLITDTEAIIRGEKETIN
ncbi:MAG: N-6 DNA methylase [Actinobacteria bacterium]|nr:N-6 DNA methylase [Actinomycetota bacterium]